MSKRLFEIDIPGDGEIEEADIEHVLSRVWTGAITVCEVTGQMAPFPTTEQLKEAFESDSTQPVVAFDTAAMDG